MRYVFIPTEINSKKSTNPRILRAGGQMLPGIFHSPGNHVSQHDGVASPPEISSNHQGLGVRRVRPDSRRDPWDWQNLPRFTIFYHQNQPIHVGKYTIDIDHMGFFNMAGKNYPRTSDPLVLENNPKNWQRATRKVLVRFWRFFCFRWFVFLWVIFLPLFSASHKCTFGRLFGKTFCWKIHGIAWNKLGSYFP